MPVVPVSLGAFRFHRGIAALLVIAFWTLIPSGALAETNSMTVQLNKLESEGSTCRAYIVLENRGEVSFDALRLDLVIFDKDGVIARRLAVDAAPMAAGRTGVRVFGINNHACDNIGRVLLNDTLNCASSSGDISGCMNRIATESIAGVPFIK